MTDTATATGLSCTEPGCAFTARSPRGLANHLTRTHGHEPAGHRRPAASGAEPGNGAPAPGGTAPEGAPPGTGPELAGPELEGAGPEPAPGSPFRDDEQQPTAPEGEGRRALRDLLGLGRDKSAPKPPRAPRQRRPLSGPREPLDELAGWVYGHLGTTLARSGTQYTPVGRVMEMQTTTIGALFDEAAAGTRVDKVLQPLVRGGRRWKKVGNAVALPVMTAVAVNHPELLGLHVEVLPDGRQTIAMDGPMAQEYYAVWEANALEMAHGFERTEQRRREVHAELSALPFLRPVVEAGGDPVLWLIAKTFAPPQAEPEPAPAAAGNGSTP